MDFYLWEKEEVAGSKIRRGGGGSMQSDVFTEQKLLYRQSITKWCTVLMQTPPISRQSQPLPFHLFTGLDKSSHSEPTVPSNTLGIEERIRWP
jgi:hypothetical protein